MKKETHVETLIAGVHQSFRFVDSIMIDFILNRFQRINEKYFAIWKIFNYYCDRSEVDIEFYTTKFCQCIVMILKYTWGETSHYVITQCNV